MTFLLSGFGREVMTSSRLSIHLSNVDIYYDNHNTGDNIFTFMIDQQNEDTA